MRAPGGPAAGAVPWRVVAAVSGTCLVTLLVAWASLIGPGDVFTGPGPTPSSVTTEPAPPPPADSSRDDAEQLVRDSEPPAWVRYLAWLLLAGVLAGMALVAFLLARTIRDMWQERGGRPRVEREMREFEVLAEPGAAREAVAADEAAQDAALREGSPRNGIVAAWHRFEVQAADAGLQPRPWETSSEFVLRLLDLAGAEPRAVSAMAELYREARFSDHPLGEADRDRAVELLAGIRLDVRLSR